MLSLSTMVGWVSLIIGFTILIFGSILLIWVLVDAILNRISLKFPYTALILLLLHPKTKKWMRYTADLSKALEQADKEKHTDLEREYRRRVNYYIKKRNESPSDK